MKGLTRIEVAKRYSEITAKYGKPTSGHVYCENQLFSKIVEVLSCYDECNIIYEYGRWDISPDVCIRASYGTDRERVGTVYKTEWFTAEQIKALHELAFGYQF